MTIGLVKLKKLNFARNRIGDDGATAVAVALPGNLHELGFEDNEIGDTRFHQNR